MSSVSRKNHGKNTEFNVVYSNMRGVDFSGDGSTVSRSRFAYLENMYRDYDGDGAGVIESIPGYRRIIDLKSPLHGLHSYKNELGECIVAAHVGSMVYYFPLPKGNDPPIMKTVRGLSEHRSTSFSSGGALYVLDGENITVISANYVGQVADEESGVYVPTTYLNGKEYEQRNLLTRSFTEKTVLGGVSSYSYGTVGIKYRILDEQKKQCTVAGTSDQGIPTLYIPSRAKIGDTFYDVIGIDDFAFREHPTLTEVFIAPGASYIGLLAFSNCKSLYKVTLADTVVTLGNGCFSGDVSLQKLHIGKTMADVGESTFSLCTEIESITYSGGEADFLKIANASVLDSSLLSYNTPNNEAHIFIPINSPCTEISYVKVNGKKVAFSTEYENELVRGIKLYFAERADAEGAQIVAAGTLSSRKADYNGLHAGFLCSAYKDTGEVDKIIKGCTVAESFDGRIFLTGNPEYPGYVFYTGSDLDGRMRPLYFGELNYFLDGVSGFGNVALLAAGDSLAVFKEDDGGDGSIFYHTPKETGIDLVPKIYPVSYVHTGICAVGGAISFFDDPVFISKKGLSALSKKAINLERSIATRSSMVNARLLREDLSSARLAIFKGYLAVAAGGHIYLADARATFTNDFGDMEYEWYYLSDIGCYTHDTRVYRYSSVSDVLLVKDTPDERVSGTVNSTHFGGKLIYFVNENNKLYEVYPTEERTGGEFTPLTEMTAVDDRLVFGSANGVILTFNTDMAGIAPASFSAEADFDKEEYEKNYKGLIHPYYYSFDGHPARYALMSAKDNCSIPHMAKNTVKNSLTLKARAIGGGSLKCEVWVGGDGYSEICTFPNRDIFFSDIDFGSFTMQTESICTFALKERKKRWVEKQITLYSNEYASPFGIYSIAYRFFVKGKIRKNK